MVEMMMSESVKPYFAMVCLQFGYAGMNLITKVVLDRGMSHYVLVVYRNAFATAALAPFAILSERKVRPKLTFPIFMQIFALSLLGPVIDQNLYYAGLKLTSPTFSSAVNNILPAVTFILAILFRMEKVEMKKVRCKAKVVGTVVTVVGGVVMVLYKGPLIIFFTSHPPPALATVTASAGDWLRASVFLVLASLSWACFFILQTATLKRYSAHMSLSAMVCFLGTLNSAAVTFLMERNQSAWNIGFDMSFLASAYAGIVSSGIAYYVQGMMTQRKGPVFVTAFNPLVVIIVSVLGSFILGYRTYLGGALGMVLLMAGLSTVLWGKHKENSETQQEILENVKSDIQNTGVSKMPRIEEGEDDEDDVEKQSVMAVAAEKSPATGFCDHVVGTWMAAKDASRA
ncbi:PREDICTED: WAT1-related protein At2g40900 [Tarenaya hassleriana]|uniref:WAT1-related protein At2g40900 n=1 Tax=Tarenaya hassleriana TaxID=28532 RepID=UPI00053C5378|nr:PREDICTED: WAT1-related protein At2g40900 [Tarenaya hassleriana]